ncbi:MAG: CooT family nickel-binding protein [Candidatus Bathyarchaeia archaeon]
MCEFTVFLEGEKVFEDVIYAKAEGWRVTLKDVLGVSRVLENCRITEIDVSSERLVLSPIEDS